MILWLFVALCVATVHGSPWPNQVAQSAEITLTYPALIGMERSKEHASALVAEALDALAIFDDRADPLREIARYVIERKK